MQAETEARARLDDAVAGTWLAWVGGVASLVGIALLLVLAIAHGWIGPTARVGIAGLGASALLAGGVWLKRRHGRTAAPYAMAFAGTAAWGATLLAADRGYELVGTIPALLGVAAVGSVATALAIRWRSRAVGLLGLVGPLVIGLATAPGDDVLVLAALALAAAAAAAVAIRQQWSVIAGAAVLVAELDAAVWMFSRASSTLSVLAMVPFALLAVAACAALQHGAADGRRSRAATTLLVFSALVVVAAAALSQLQGGWDGAPHVIPVNRLWASVGLVCFAAIHVGVAIVGIRRFPTLEPLAAAALALATVLIDLALAINLHGIALTAGWGTTALAIATARRRPAGRVSDRALVDFGLSAHAGLVLLRALIAAPPSLLVTGGVTLPGAAAVTILAAVCIAAARTAPHGTEFTPTVLGAVGLAAVAYLTATTLSGPALVSAWCAEAVALAALGRRQPDRVALFGALAFLAGGWIHALVIEAPPWALITGAPSLPAALWALGPVTVATELVRRTLRDARRAGALLALATIAPLYVGSIGIITAFQPATSVGLAVLNMTVRQQGQVLMSALWTVSGLCLLLVGLRRNLAGLRRGGLVLLLISAAKVFLYDLAMLTSVYRVASFILLGLLLLAGAFAYERLRPGGLH